MSSAPLSLLQEEKASSGTAKRRIYRISTETGQCVLRLYRPAFSGIDSHISSKKALRSQHHWLESLKQIYGLSLPAGLRRTIEPARSGLC